MSYVGKSFFYLVMFFVQSVLVFGQSKIVGVDDFATWGLVTISSFKLSDDGRVASYYVYNKPTSRKVTLVLKSMNGPWKKEFPLCTAVGFTDDNKKMICAGFKDGNNELIVQKLNSEDKEIILNVGKYSIWRSLKKDWLVYIRKGGNYSDLILRNLARDTDTIVYKNVSDYVFSSQGDELVMVSKIDSINYLLRLLDIKNKDTKEIYQGVEPQGLLMGNEGKKLMFLTKDVDDGKGLSKKLWYYDEENMPKARLMAPSLSIDDNMEIESLESFNDKYGFVYCNLVSRTVPTGLRSTSEPMVWSYSSPKLASQQANEEKEPYRCAAVWYLNQNEFKQVQKKGELLMGKSADGRYELLLSEISHIGEWNWNERSVPLCILLDLSNGNRKYLSNLGDRNAASYVLSPNGNFIVYYEPYLSSYFGYNIENGKRTNLTPNVAAKWTSFDKDDIPYAKFRNIGVGGFSSDGSEVYLYDQYDIFQVDVAGNRPPINLTDGYGRRNNIVFRLAFQPDKWKPKRFLLTAFNRKTKEDGFFEVENHNPKSINLLSMNPFMLSGPDESKYTLRIMPVKAKNASVFLLSKMDAAHAPDICVTSDFKTFKSISDVHPEKAYNWLTTELVNFKTLDGVESQGILYKPSNFDPRKKYPIVFYFYEKVSECLNLFIMPEESTGPVNIPYLVSNGYLVFTPDIHFQVGYPGRSSYNAVMGAANEIVKRPYVDSLKMGLQGHSFGGFQTNYIISHTNRFAAACSAAGFTDFVSSYGSIVGNGFSRQGQFELYRDRIGATLWSRPDLYLENSPVLRIDKIKTPVLIMHNNEDNDVPVGQGIEFFTGLRRLGKVAYLLQYDGEGHVVFGDAAKDYSKRMLDFFNYYLRSGEIPSWMSSKRVEVIDFQYPFSKNR